jgi:nucleotide-binding universal stress UspA family protein
MMAGRRVLFATDGSTAAEDALELVIASLEPDGIEEIEVLSVVPRSTRWPRPGREDHGPISVIDSAHRTAAEATVEAAGDRLRAAGFPVAATVLDGHAAETIVRHAEARSPDLIVVGTRGLGELRRQVVGSVSGKVARYAPTSVLVAWTADPIRRIVLGYDASPDADLALDLVSGLPLKGAVSVTVCAVYEVVSPLMSGLAPTMVAQVHTAHQEDLREARAAAESIAADAARRLSERGLVAGPRAAHGSPYAQLTVVAGDLSADLVVVGSRGLSGIERFFLGSTSAALVAHPPASVLVARGRREA